MEDPKDIRQNIQHYHRLLTLNGTRGTQDQVIKLLGEAEAQLYVALAKDVAEEVISVEGRRDPTRTTERAALPSDPQAQQSRTESSGQQTAPGRKPLFRS